MSCNRWDCRSEIVDLIEELSHRHDIEFGPFGMKGREEVASIVCETIAEREVKNPPVERKNPAQEKRCCLASPGKAPQRGAGPGWLKCRIALLWCEVRCRVDRLNVRRSERHVVVFTTSGVEEAACLVVMTDDPNGDLAPR